MRIGQIPSVVRVVRFAPLSVVLAHRSACASRQEYMSLSEHGILFSLWAQTARTAQRVPPGRDAPRSA